MKTRIELKKTCTLKRFGYAMKDAKTKRSVSLKRAIREYGSRYVIQKLVVLRTYRKAQRTPGERRFWSVLDSDIKYVQKVRDGMSPSSRNKDKLRSKIWSTKRNSQKSFCPS